MKRMACVVAIATGTGLPLMAATQPAWGEPLAAAVRSGLQISINSPDIESGDSAVTLDVNFRGGNIRSVELYVDGSLVKRQNLRTHDGHGSILFSLDRALLPDGGHAILVKAIDTGGNTATATSHIAILPDDANSIMKFLYPRRGAIVQGVVPIEISLDRSIVKPYVMFFVDDDFKSVTNFAPYTFNWDTSHVPNGPHTITVKAIEGDTAAEIKALTLHVRVDNPGGLTTRQPNIPDLNPAKGAAKHTDTANATLNRVNRIAEGAPNVGPPGGSLYIEDPVLSRHRNAGLSSPETRLRGAGVPNASPRLPAPEVGTVEQTLNVVPTQFEMVRTAVRSAADNLLAYAIPNPRLSRPVAADRIPSNYPLNRTIVKTATPGILGALADPAELLPPVTAAAPTLGLVRAAIRPRHAGNVAAVPSSRCAAVADPVQAHAKPAVATAPASGRTNVLANMVGSTFDVAFDNTQIAFDVPPRIENGLPLAPFRAIFEHSGGTVRWFNQSKIVHAFNATREIELRIGQLEAKVNNQPIRLDAKPYIDRGRTIVPLSFIRDAMDVDVEYDAATGHLRISSKQ